MVLLFFWVYSIAGLKTAAVFPSPVGPWTIKEDLFFNDSSTIDIKRKYRNHKYERTNNAYKVLCFLTFHAVPNSKCKNKGSIYKKYRKKNKETV